MKNGNFSQHSSNHCKNRINQSSRNALKCLLNFSVFLLQVRSSSMNFCSSKNFCSFSVSGRGATISKLVFFFRCFREVCSVICVWNFFFVKKEKMIDFNLDRRQNENFAFRTDIVANFAERDRHVLKLLFRL